MSTAMTRAERDDVAYKLGECFEFYGKTPSDSQTRIWMQTLLSSGYRAADLCRGFDDHFAGGRYMPKPAEILALADQRRAQRRAKEGSAEETPPPCDPEIASAWTTYMKFAFGFDAPGSHRTMDIDRAIEICNREAAKYGQPDAVLPEHKLPEYWGTQSDLLPL